MKKMIVGLALAAVATTHTLAGAAQPVAALDRAGSPVSESEELAGGGGIWAVIAAVVIGVGAIILIEEEEEDLPDSP